nr:unnamed protein product [Digitaria exilis]
MQTPPHSLRRKPTPALPDDVLHLILGFLPEATAAARTAVLSRRWWHVWVHAHKFVFSDDLAPAAALGNFASFVDRLFARREGAEWTRYAVRHVVDFFLLRVSHVPPAATVELELPSHGRTRSIQLDPSGSCLRLPQPAASMYEALAELVLDSARLGDDVLLGDFVSSCCPRLRKLAIGSPLDLRELVLRVDALQELRLSRAEDLRTLDVTAPNLRVLWLDLDRCFPHGAPGNDGGVSGNRVACCRVVAPRLQVIGMRDATLAKLPGMDIHDLASVRCLDLCLHMRGWCCRRTSSGLWLLENCPGVQHVQVSLSHYCGLVVTLTGRLFVGLGTIFAADEFIGLGRKGAAPFASVTSLKVDTTSLPESYLVPSITSLLLRFPRLTSLSISSNRQGTGCNCCYAEYSPSGNHHRKISLGSLEVVEISGFTWAKEEMDLVSLLFESSSSIKRMTILTGAAKISGSHSLKPAAPSSWKLMMGEVDPMVDEELKRTTCIKRITCSTSRGRWDIKEGVYTWTHYAAEAEAEGSINN